MPLILILVGIVYIAETLSDIIQVVYFKATHGKRIFRMAPFTITSKWEGGARKRWWRCSHWYPWRSAPWRSWAF